MFELTPVLTALETSFLADWAGGPMYPVISAVHILAIAFVIAPTLMADYRVLAEGEMDAQVVALSRVALGGFAAAAVTGILLISVQATRYAENPAIYWKFGLMAVAGANALVFHQFGKLRRAIAASSALVWCGVLLAGRWIAFAA